jgi:hypothetical protein
VCCMAQSSQLIVSASLMGTTLRRGYDSNPGASRPG